MTNNCNERQNMEFNGYNFKAEWNISNFQVNNPEYYSPIFGGDNFEVKLTFHQNISENNNTSSISFEIISIQSDVYLTYYLINDNEIIAAGKKKSKFRFKLKVMILHQKVDTYKTAPYKSVYSLSKRHLFPNPKIL